MSKITVLGRFAPVLVFAVASCMGPGAARAQNDQPQQAAPSLNKGAPAINKKEEDAYKALFAARGGNAATQIQLGEKFLKDFPQSHYLPGVYAQLTATYFSEGQEDKSLAAANKTIELNPDNVDVLSLLAMALPRRVEPNAPDAQQQYQKAEGYARRAIELVPKLLKPEGFDDATFEKAKNAKLAMAHSGLGLIDLRRQKFEDARTELTQAVQLTSDTDPVNYYLLGVADEGASYYNDAAAAYGKCADEGPLASQCKAGAEIAKKDAATKPGR